MAFSQLDDEEPGLAYVPDSSVAKGSISPFDGIDALYEIAGIGTDLLLVR